jgi:signal transduction histidine kinase
MKALSEKQIQMERASLDRLYLNQSSTIVSAIIISFLAVYLIFTESIKSELYIWLFFVNAVNLLRAFNIARFKKTIIPDNKILFWKRKQEIIISLAPLCWAIFIGVFYQHFPPSEVNADTRLAMILIFIGYITSGIFSNNSSKIAALSFPILMTPVLTYNLMMEGGKNSITYAVLGIFYVVLMGRIAFKIKKQAENNMKLLLEKQKLINEVQEKYAIKKQLEREKVNAIEKTKLASLGEMASSIAHEINNPLTVITGATWTIKKMIEKEQYQAIIPKVTKIEDTARKIGQIVKSMRTLARNTEGDPLQVISLGRIIEDTLPICTQKLFMKNIRLDKSCLDEKLLVECRLSEVGQILVNLFNNAIDELQKIDTQRWIKLESFVEESILRVKVIDAGLGVDPEVAEKMFEPFYTTKELGQGTGLGLSLSKSLMAGFGGDIYIDSSAKNTTFVLEFPLIDQKQKEDDPKEPWAA